MANPQHVERIKGGSEQWNRWREKDVTLIPDLSETNLADINFGAFNLERAILKGSDLCRCQLHCNLRHADLGDAALRFASLWQADLTGANLERAKLSMANLRHAAIGEARLVDADLTGADLTGADLSGADLTGAQLTGASLVQTNLTRAKLRNCRVFGVSAWDLKIGEAIQENLIITPEDKPTVTVDRLDVAQFIYMLLNNQTVRDVIDTITSKAVLILGRFTPERKMVLDALRQELRQQNLLPILFDFEGPSNRNLTETISTLAHMAKFVIADLTDAKSIPQELQCIVPQLPSVPVQPLILASQFEYAMFRDFLDYPWVLQPYRYASAETLLVTLHEKVVAPASAMATAIRERRAAFTYEDAPTRSR